MKNFCVGCGFEHSDFNWVCRQYEVRENEYEYGYFCRKWHKPTRSTFESQKCKWEREKHIKDITQPFDHDEPNPKFAKMYQNEPEKLKRVYNPSQLKKVGMEKI